MGWIAVFRVPPPQRAPANKGSVLLEAVAEGAAAVAEGAAIAILPTLPTMPALAKPKRD